MHRPMRMAKAGGGNVDNLVDLEEIVRKWAVDVFNYSKTKEQARIPQELLQFNINWKQVRFHFDEPVYDILPLAGGGGGPKQSVQPQTLFRTFFANNTNQEQEYSFKTERCTRSMCTVCVEQGYTRGFDFALKMKTPGEVVEANAGFKREMTVVNIGEETIEEELVWGVDSSVRVPPHTETTAELVVTEAQCTGNFILLTRFHGKVLVTVTNLKENNALLTVIEGNIADIVNRELQRGLKGFKVQGKVVLAETRGKCQFKFGIEQRVRVTEAPINCMEP